MIFGLASWSFPCGVALDALIGDPRGWPHPVRGIGRLISATEDGLRWLLQRIGASSKTERLAGVILTVIVVAITGLVTWTLLTICDRTGPIASFLGRTLMVHFGLAARSLRDESLKASEAVDLPSARRELTMIVGRDTADLDWPQIHRACIETVAENASDGVVAPIFAYLIGGVVGLWIFKAINTLDSMVGHRDDRYQYVGWASARLDDVVGWIPARLTWLLIAISSAILGDDPRSAFRVGWRDGRNHPSPNSGWSEAAMAGALNIQLGGPLSYDGVGGFKPLLGDPLRAIDANTVRRSLRNLVVATMLAASLAWAIRVGVFGLA